MPPSLSRRRAAAALLPAAALLAGAWPARAADSIGSSGAAAPAQAGPASSFYSQWPYLQPADILPFLRATATPGDIDSVLHAIDEFAAAYPMFR